MQHFALQLTMTFWTSAFIIVLLCFTLYFLFCSTSPRSAEEGKEWGLDFKHEFRVVESWRVWLYSAKDKYVSCMVSGHGVQIECSIQSAAIQVLSQPFTHHFWRFVFQSLSISSVSPTQCYFETYEFIMGT